MQNSISQNVAIAEAYDQMVAESLFDETKADTYSVLEEFKDDRERGIKRMIWNLIPAKQYAYAVRKFSESDPETFVFSESLLDKWIEIIRENTQIVNAISNLTGRDELNGAAPPDLDAIWEVFPKETDAMWEEIRSDKDRIPSRDRANTAYGVLEKLGFYEWAVLPDGGTADSDNGVGNVEELFDEFDGRMKGPAEKLVFINRCMDVFHRRSDWAAAFIEGGRKTLTAISSGSFYGN